MKLVRGVPLLLERHVHVRGYVSVPLYKHKTNSMVQTIATLIDETLMVMGAHLHVRMTDEEKAYLDAHFELIHIKKGEHLVTRGEEVCYLYYLESGIVRLWFPDKENREISARFIQAKEFINFFLSHEEHHAHYNIKALEPCKIWRLPKKDLHQLYELSINFNKLARIHLVRSINRKREAVSNVSRAVCAKSPIPALEGILLKAQEGQLQLTGYDLELGIVTTIEAKTEQQGELVLSAKLLLDIIRRIPGETVSIVSDEKNLATIRGGASEFTIPGILADEYPELPNVEEKSDLVMKQGTLKSMIDQTLFAIATTDSKPVHTGSLFDIKDSCVTLVSVDGYRLALRREAIVSDLNTKFIVPGKTLSEISKLLREEDEEAYLVVSQKHIVFRISGYYVVSRLLEGDFLDYNAAIPKISKTTVKINTRSLTDSVERTSLLISDRLRSPIRLVVTENKVQLSCSTAMGKAHDEVDCEVSGEAVSMGFNNKYLLDALKASDCDMVKLEINGALSPMRMIPMEGDSFLFLVLPVRVKNDD